MGRWRPTPARSKSVAVRRPRPLLQSASRKEGAAMAKAGPELLEDPIARELLASTIPARLAYVSKDGTPRVVPI